MKGFYRLCDKYYRNLQMGFVNELSKAGDVIYAKDYVGSQLMSEGALLPHSSYYLRVILEEFKHEYKLNVEQAVSNTLSRKDECLADSQKELDRLKSILDENWLPGLEKSTSKETTEALQEQVGLLRTQIANEEKTRQFSDRDLMKFFLRFLALEQLRTDFAIKYDPVVTSAFYTDSSRLFENPGYHNMDRNETLDAEPIGQVEQDDGRLHFTHNQRMLAAYYMMLSIGIEPRKAVDIAPFARMNHLLSGLPLGKITNSDLYKKARKVPNLSGDKKLLRDLLLIRPYFEDLELHDVIREIDKQVQETRDEIDFRDKNQ